jgi:hypothetical protein
VLVLAGSAGTASAQASSAAAQPLPECVTQFTAIRSDVEQRGLAAKAASEKHASRAEMCKLVTAYGAAESKWIEFAEGNMSKCGIPKDIVAQLKTVHARTAEGQKKLCTAGFQPGFAPEDAPRFAPGDLREDYRFGPPTEPERVRSYLLDIAG